MKSTIELGLISGNAFDSIIKRFPKIEPSYETTLHTAFSVEYDVCLAIPISKKYFAWFSFYNNSRVCYLMQLNRDKKIESITIVNTNFSSEICVGTLIYGSISIDFDATNSLNASSHPLSFFIIEDIMMFKGINTVKMTFGEKLGFIHTLLDKMLNPSLKKVISRKPHLNIVFMLPAIIVAPKIGENTVFPTVLYQIHHIQYRSLSAVLPYINANVLPAKNAQTLFNNTTNSVVANAGPVYKRNICDFSKSQYSRTAIFMVKACLQYDIYDLFALGGNNVMVLYDVAYISNYKLSTFMNTQFRTIRENSNLDYIEESDDEDDFQDNRFDKYVNLQKSINMECVFNEKFKRWEPLRIVSEINARIVRIHNLVR